MAVVGGGRKPDSPPETEFSRAPKNPRNHFNTMNELAHSAREVLNAMENDGIGEIYIINFIKSVEQYALKAPKGDKPQVQVMEKVQQALDRLDQRMEIIEKATAPSTQTSNSNDSAAFWARLQKWGQGTGSGPPPSLPNSNGSSSVGVSPAELREDREIIVKIRDSDTRETLRRRTPREIVEQAERTREQAARKKASAPLGGGCYFVAAKVLPSGDIKMTADSASGAELLRKHADGWLKSFGPAAHVRKPTWGVVTRGIDTKTMQLTPESMGSTAKELIRQNSHSWGGSQEIEILHLGWLIKPGKRREGSIVIEFTSPVVANQAITQGTLWQHQVHQTTRFCREGRSKLCLKCQKPGHVHSQCLNEYQCGHCAKGHPTWECPSKHGEVVEAKCANCGGAHRPTSDTCEVRTAAKEEARLALANSPLYHRIPLHFRQREAAKSSTTTSQSQQGLDTSIHAPQSVAQQEIVVPQPKTIVKASSKRIPIPASSEIRRMYAKVGAEKPQNRRKEPATGHAMRTRSRTSEDDDLPAILEEHAESAIVASQSARSLRSQNQAPVEFMTDPEKQLQAIHKKRRMIEPADVMEEDQEWEQPTSVVTRMVRRYQNAQLRITEVEDDPEEEFHDASEHSDAAEAETDTHTTTSSQ
ncbi:uncharacterized protein N7500_009004 [Penicillium coprophilum]|uniref:uncharacterized protein n=1 Tax=Penicillium coprophilum TaxID=36646 RepID=UPI00239EDB01|nr:uncharacterized protein N7500_009004 [Penicillium coprophilum]KAJ5159353.1 hypothetical protein N7500_009004 [Penicillium coprophilum]